MSLYEQASDRIVVQSQETSYSLFEVFDDTDTILVELMKEFSDIYIGFGSLGLINTGEEGAYRIYLDGHLVGTDRNLTSFDKILNKNYLLEIRQTRFGSDHVIYSSDIQVQERQKTELVFQLPFLTSIEQARVDDVRSRTLEVIALDELDTEYLEGGELEELILLMQNLDFCPSLEPLRNSLQSLLDDYNDEMVYRDVIKDAYIMVDHTSRSEYMNRLSSQDPSRQAYINMAEFVYVVKTIEAVKRWGSKDILPGRTQYLDGIDIADSNASEFLAHAGEELVYINSIFSSYYNKTVRNRAEVLSLIKKYYHFRFFGKLYNENTFIFRLSKSKIADLKEKLLALEVPEPIELKELQKFSFAPALFLGGFSGEESEYYYEDFACIGVSLGLGVLVNEFFSITGETGLFMTSRTVYDWNTDDVIEEEPFSVSVIPLGFRMMFGNRRSSFAGGLGLNYFFDLPMADINTLPVFMPELVLYYKDLFIIASIWGSGDFTGTFLKVGYEFR
jgi:hypothetical protein